MAVAREPIRILVVDDHAAVREGLRGMLAAEPDLRPVATAASAREALDLTDPALVDLALVDYHLPDEDGLSLCLRMKLRAEAPRVVVYTAFADDMLGLLAVVAGADGLLGKSESTDDLCSMVRAVARGEAWAPRLSPALMETFRGRLDADDLPILGMLLHGTPAAEIAETLGVTQQWLAARRWALLESLRARPARRARPPHRPVYG